jgi:ankyrin repeat protein
VNAKGRWDRTPLHCSARYGHIDILHLLVENGADLEAQNNDGWRVLHRAAYNYNHLPFIQELISRYHVDINARDNDGRTALRVARMIGRTEIITFLQSNGGIDDGMEEDDDFLFDEEEEDEEDHEDEDDDDDD